MAHKTLENTESNIDFRKALLIAWDEEGERLTEAIVALLKEKRFLQAHVQQKLSVDAPRVSRWLNPKEHNQLPVWALKEIAALVDREVLMALVDTKGLRGDKEKVPTSPLVREFFVGMGYINHREGPAAVGRLIASVWGATSWILYRENSRRNILESSDGEGVADPGLMQGPSWAGELPIRIIKMHEAKSQKPSENSGAAPLEFSTFNWDVVPETSAFARRENVKFCIGIPIYGEGMPAAILFLNYGRKPPDSFLDPEALATAAHVLRGVVRQAWSPILEVKDKAEGGDKGKTGGAEPRCGEVLGLMRLAFNNTSSDRLDSDLVRALQQVAHGLWPTQQRVCKVHALTQYIRCQVGKPEDVSVKFWRDEPNRDAVPDEMIRRSATDGETFYIENLNRNGMRARFDRENRIPAGQEQRMVVPFRCEPFLDNCPEPEEAGARGGAEGRRVLRVPVSPKDYITWGALSVESPERIFSRAELQELGILAHLVSCGVYIRQKAAEAAEPSEKNFFDHLLQAVNETIDNIIRFSASNRDRGEGREASSHGPGNGGSLPYTAPLDPLCRAVVEHGLIGPMERCDVYPYDPVAGVFTEGGCYTAQEWLEYLRKGQGRVFLEGGTIRLLCPRKGGNSERLLGVADEYHIITNAYDHPRVSPVTKMIDTKSLVGCSCKIGSSFKGEAVLWLGSHNKSVEADFLQANGCRMLRRLRVVAHVAAMFCVLLRWWANGVTPCTSREVSR